MTLAPDRTWKFDRDPAALAQEYRTVRQLTERLVANLEPDDFLLQFDADCSPPKWQLAHTTWFFETFLLQGLQPSYQPFHPQFGYLFNSYYVSAGPRWARPQRGLLNRPTLPEVWAYRRSIDEQVLRWIDSVSVADWARGGSILELGLHHEQQHQELILTDLKPAFALNPLGPAYQRIDEPEWTRPAEPLSWRIVPAGLVDIGHAGAGFHFDNEGPRHRTYLTAFAIAERLVTVGEYLQFIQDGGYDRPELWLSAGWATRQAEGWDLPLYWRAARGPRDAESRPESRTEVRYERFGLHGWQPLREAAAMTHLSFFEAEAYARWAGARLPTEAEWEVAAGEPPREATWLDDGPLDPPAATDPAGAWYGQAWQWTASPYVAYPGYRPLPGQLGEYNGKFMCDQWVLRGGSCWTPRGHMRRTYRNFFPAATRRQMAGLRLAREVTV